MTIPRLSCQWMVSCNCKQICLDSFSLKTWAKFVNLLFLSKTMNIQMKKIKEKYKLLHTILNIT